MSRSSDSKPLASGPDAAPGVWEVEPNPAPARASATFIAHPDFRFMRSRLSHWIALGFGAGLSRFAPGTVATLWAWASFLVIDHWLDAMGWGGLLALGFAAGIVACARTGAALGKDDHGAIVWDEIIAFWAVLWVLGQGANQWAAFVLFRFFDIVKPPPIGWVDRTFKGGTGVMADDLMAGFMTLLTIALWRTI